MMLPINTVEMRLNVKVNVIDYTSFQKCMFQCFISPSKELPKKQPLLLWKSVYKNFQRPELDNLVKMSLKLICLNNKKDKIDGKANNLFIDFQHAIKFCSCA